jgi:radical SAM protein with 4Fe4S-binding SPASM domain
MRELVLQEKISDLTQLAMSRRFPLRAEIDVTYRCNFKCIHCYNSPFQKTIPQSSEITNAQIKKIIDELVDLGSFSMAFTGGEPLLRKDILDILWYARSKGIYVSLFTNGYFVNKKLAREFRFMNLSVHLTVNACRESTLKKITGVKGAFKRLMKTVSLLKENRVDFMIKSCLMRANKEEFVGISTLARRLKVPFKFDITVGLRIDGGRDKVHLRVPLQEGIKIRRLCFPEMFDRNDRSRKPREIITSIGNHNRYLKYCSAGFDFVHINALGEMNMCVGLTIPRYNVLNGSVKEGWELIKGIVDFYRGRNKLEKICDSCEVKKYCFMCPARVYLETGKLYSCSPFTYQEALINKEHIRGLREETMCQP